MESFELYFPEMQIDRSTLQNLKIKNKKTDDSLTAVPIPIKAAELTPRLLANQAVRIRV